MEDTKKLIEKYKRELMELSKTRNQEPTAREPQIIGYIENNPEGIFGNAVQDPTNTPAEPITQDERNSAAEPDIPENQGFIPKYEDLNEAPPQADIPLSAPEPRTETVPQFPYHHKPEAPPPDYSKPQTDFQPQSPDTPNVPSPEEYEPPYANPEMAQNEPNSARFPNLEQNGSQSQPPNFPQPQYSSFEDFQTKNPGQGTIIFRISTAQDSLPIKNAKCVLTKKINGIIHEIDVLFTDESGKTEPRILPAPPRSLSQEYDNKIQPFALYDATVTRDGFVDVVLTDIPVFDKVQSVQRVSMLPSGSDDEVEIITEVNRNAR